VLPFSLPPSASEAFFSPPFKGKILKDSLGRKKALPLSLTSIDSFFEELFSNISMLVVIPFFPRLDGPQLSFFFALALFFFARNPDYFLPPRSFQERNFPRSPPASAFPFRCKETAPIFFFGMRGMSFLFSYCFS